MSEVHCVQKFGGTSLADAARFAACKNLLQQKPSIVVVSATAGTTTQLQEALRLAKQQLDSSELLSALYLSHQTLVESLLGDNRLLITLKQDFKAIKALLNAISLVGDFDKAMQDRVLSYGELWSAKILSAYLGEKTVFLDAAEVLTVHWQDNICVVDWQKSASQLHQFVQNHPFHTLVITGFLAATRTGLRTTLGLNGSDFSAAIFAKLFAVKALIIWTDVDGIHTAPPKKVHSAKVIEALSYKEALEMAYFGASIIHPQALQPAMDSGITIQIKNSFNPNNKGTCISAQSIATAEVVRGLSAVEHVALINIEGTGLMGVSGMASRVFSALKSVHVSVLLISQASSEHSICLAVNEAEALSAKETLKTTFQFEVEQGLIEKIDCDSDCAIIVAVGDAMVGRPGVAAKLLTNLANACINVHAISQGSSERNISVVIKRNMINKALRVVHSGFYLSNRTLSVGLLGPGNVGRCFLEQLLKMEKVLKEKSQINLQIRGIASSKKMLLSEKPIVLSQWQKQFEQEATPLDMDKFISHILSDDRPHALLVDCTASKAVAQSYVSFIEKGLHIITPSKQAASSDYAYYQALHQACRDNHRYYLYETNVCAGLPIINTLQDLIQTGDEIIAIKGIVSGTLSYVFSELSQGKLFSDVIKIAHQKGYTEPDPRDDLSGMDVARKCVCLARELGYQTSIEDVNMEALLPKALITGSMEHFWHELTSVDGLFKEKVDKALKNNQQLAYVGHIDKQGKITIAIENIDEKSPFYGLKGTDNRIVFYSKRYKENPLVVQGPGAGAEVTASGVFADVLRLVSYVGG